jgi:uncharacterized membrane protein HdeD (DUF308 family)
MGNIDYRIDHSGILSSSEVYYYFKKNWGWFLFAGILLLVLGVLSLGSSFLTGVYSIIILAGILAIAGFIQLIEGISTRKWGGFFLHLLLGLLYIAVALVMFMNPVMSLTTFTLIAAGFFFTAGLFRMIGSLIIRFARWGWTFFSGLVTLVLAVLVWMSWPESSLWVIGTFVGIDLLFYGWSIIIFALASKKILRRMRDIPPRGEIVK